MGDSFTLTETYALGGAYSWRLKDSELRFRGSGRFESMVLQRISVSTAQISEFVNALSLLDVWSWRDDYKSMDLDLETMDGSEWTFAVKVDSRECRCGGGNGYPSFANARLTSLDRGRFACLVAAMYACFDVKTYIHLAAHQRQRDAGKA